ncbi:T9SS type A sorting domain-containing protein [bacterium]|nr:T9SS type A sorting domain-containing protein [bacterium]
MHSSEKAEVIPLIGVDKPVFKILCFGFMIAHLSLFTQDWQSYHTGNSALPSNTVRAVCVEPDGVKWFGTDAGLVRYDGSEWRVFVKTEDRQTLADDHITDIAFEVSGYGPEIWVGTQNGLTILDVDGFTFATPYRSDNRPLLGNRINAVAVDSNHVKWFATNNGVSIFNGSNWWALTEENDKLIHNEVLCIGVDNECDSLWRYFGTSEKGVSRIYYQDLDAVTTASPYNTNWTIMMSDSVFAFHVTYTQKHWIGTSFGVCEHDSTETKRNWNIYTTYEGLVQDNVLSIAEAQDGSMWFGTRGGVSHYYHGKIINYTIDDGLAGNVVYDIAIDKDGSLWFATNGGVTRLSNIKSIGEMPHESGLVMNYPNPFNPSTTVQYEVTRSGFVRLVIYDLTGREVDRLVNAIQGPGTYRVVWNGTDRLGRSVPAGVYIAGLTIKGLGMVNSIKMIIMK